MLETDRDLAECCSGGFRAADGVTGGILAIDWALRLSSCVADVRFGRLGGLWGRVAFALTRLSLLDALAAVPVLLSLLVPHPEAEVFEDNPWAPWLWVGALRVLSLLKLERYSRSYAALVRVVYSKRGQLWASLVAALAALAVSATTLYLAELHSPKPLRSVIEAGYLAFITLTTVGYGDYAPNTSLARLLACATALCGIGIVALPSGVISAGFLEEVSRRDNAIVIQHLTNEVGRVAGTADPVDGGARDGALAGAPSAAEAPPAVAGCKEDASLLWSTCPHCAHRVSLPLAGGASAAALLQLYDADRDGQLSADELRQMLLEQVTAITGIAAPSQDEEEEDDEEPGEGGGGRGRSAPQWRRALAHCCAGTR
ncbi:hypothetical protein FNF29_06842 [Cafeteria roenbergensis]|uniref:EF-hand domain-containing protein n=1 Tax=Cafeteria roenbergensis TaxID=33653 RepID=A0A5A8C581_CAFRO|nr:hypothetical protein FNF29_06842 [Cafeteria roenbergensis]|eukprot:KAA0148183.1 hypothetical protein FNF29_06842 [Cafeteria roenbergensis]